MNVAHQCVERAQQEFADAHVVDQPPVLVRHIDHVQRLRVAPVFADVVEHALDGPVRAHAHEVRRHQTAHAVVGIIQERLGDGLFLRREELEELRHRHAGQLLEQRRAVVRRHVVEDARGIHRAHRLQHGVLRIHIQILEDIARQHMRQQAEDDRLLLLRQVRDALRDVRRRPVRKRLAKRGKIARFDQLFDFRADEVAEHRPFCARWRSASTPKC